MPTAADNSSSLVGLLIIVTKVLMHFCLYAPRMLNGHRLELDDRTILQSFPIIGSVL